ncbi:Urb2/Npa2 family-domain-containing protein [Irpex rosettiformis]|uniref:Urb2/Npa2 family-domain-containing protein n=1 Tax=Irpex rosettiformis TaxID=378272 RepID=A0ACB8TUC6_9APHY|nr:Urb2/Npa2 family-domain-containing protein [Irpex rosettiformis]
MAVSAQEFIRALKASSDPPQPGGPTKLELAIGTWHDKSLLVPNKEENIVEWLLTRLLKEKDTKGPSNPLLDLQVWKLLCDILEASARSTNASRSTRPLRSWLLPLLNRLPISPILIAFLGLADHEQPVKLFHVACKTLSLLWPLAVPKINVDTLLDCFSAITSFLAQPDWKQSDKAAAGTVLRLANLVISSYRSSLAGNVAKKKLYPHFIQSTFQSWLQCTSTDSTIPPFLEIYQAGIDTIFSVDVLRQAQGLPDDTIEDSLRKAKDCHSNAVLACIPRIFQAYIDIAQKHRNTLFTQGSSRGTITPAEQARQAGMKFFASCTRVIRCLPTSGDTWRTTAALVEIVDAQRLLGLTDEAGIESLKAVAELAYEALTSHDTGSHSPDGGFALSAFATITHIDYDLAAPILPRVLRTIAIKSLPIDLSSILLTHVLEYNTQTRSADGLVDLLLAVCSSQAFYGPSSTYGNLYVTAATSILHHHTFLGQLSKFILAFTTPGQILKIAQNTIEFLHNSAVEFENASELASGEGGSTPRKKRKTGKGSQVASTDSEPSAIAFIMTAGIASVVLTSLPLHLLQSGDRDGVVGTIQQYFDASQAVLTRATKRITRGDGSSLWTWEIVASGLLELRYALSSDRYLRLNAEGNTKVVDKLAPLLEVEGLLPQLRVEIIRTWLLDIESSHSEATPTFDHVLDYLEKWFPGRNTSWNGNLCHLSTTDDGQSQAAIAILYMIFDRWILLFEAQATSEQCRRLVMLISRVQSQQINASPSSQSEITLHDVLYRVLHNAAFWESHHLRDALLEHISEQTAHIDELDVRQLLVDFNSGAHKTPPNSLVSLVAGTFGLLMSAPMEYLTKKARSDLLRRAQSADITLSASASLEEDAIVGVTMVREFQRRTYEFQGSIDHSFVGEYLSVLMDAFDGRKTDSEGFLSTTLELIRLHLNASVKVSAQESLLIQILDSFIQSPVFNAPTNHRAGSQLRVRSLAQLIDVITTESKPTAISDELRSKLMALRGHISWWLLPQMRRITTTENAVDPTSHLPILRLWHQLLLLSSWLSCDEEYPRFGRALVARQLSPIAVTQTNDAEIYAVILSLVQVELLPQISDTGKDYTEVIATYLAFSGLCFGSVLTDLDASIAKCCRSSTSAEFSSMLDLLFGGLSANGLSENYLVNLIHVSDVIMRHAPEGSLKLLQIHLSRCLTIFAELMASERGNHLREHILTFMGNQFNDRPAMIRQQDLSNVWSILGSCFKGSSQHDSSTSKATFNGIISVISALLRLRRDLVSTTLPQLNFILRRLVMTLRRLRPHLGGKQTRLVSDTLPVWINPSEPAHGEDSKAIARLLTTLTIKTIVRTYGTSASTDGQKAESLVRPFSKHASYVLCAYIEALNDPLSVVPAEVRKELDPGLFALCEMMGENNRDAMMVASLDVGGKSVMKGIWREYEKQKYVGKG